MSRIPRVTAAQRIAVPAKKRGSMSFASEPAITFSARRWPRRCNTRALRRDAPAQVCCTRSSATAISRPKLGGNRYRDVAGLKLSKRRGSPAGSHSQSDSRTLLLKCFVNADFRHLARTRRQKAESPVTRNTGGHLGVSRTATSGAPRSMYDKLCRIGEDARAAERSRS
jgi:hypothetical protein